MSNGIERLIVNSNKSLVEFDNKVLEMYKDHKHLTITIRPGIDRSIEQNNLWAALYKRIALTLHWTFPEARSHCKLYHGVDILKREFDGFEKSFNKIFGELSEEAALRLMNANNLFPSDGFPVTRHFSTAQGAEYTESIVREFSQQGVNFNDLLDGKKKTRKTEKAI